MKKFIFIFTLFALFVNAQTHRFIYDHHYNMAAEDSTKMQTYYHLDVNPDKTYFYEHKFFVVDSLQKANKPFGFDGKMTDLLSKDRTTGTVSTITFKGFDTFVLKDQPSQNWKIMTETKMLDNLKLQKAATYWSGRNWTAWFATEIPFHEGPHKFSGLPGLIVELYDDADNFSYKLVRSEKLSENYVVGLYKNEFGNYVEIGYDRYKKLQLEYYKAPLKSLFTVDLDFKKSPLITEDGTMIDSDQKFRDYEIAEKARMRKYNNPIELDRKVNYAEK